MIIESLQTTTTNSTTPSLYEYIAQPTKTSNRLDGYSSVFSILDDAIKPVIKEKQCIPGIKRVIFSGPVAIVLWDDGTKTIVRKSSDDSNDHYAAFTAAVCKKLFGSSSAIRKIVKKAEKECAK